METQAAGDQVACMRVSSLSHGQAGCTSAVGTMVTAARWIFSGQMPKRCPGSVSQQKRSVQARSRGRSQSSLLRISAQCFVEKLVTVSYAGDRAGNFRKACIIIFLATIATLMVEIVNIWLLLRD